MTQTQGPADQEPGETISSADQASGEITSSAGQAPSDAALALATPRRPRLWPWVVALLVVGLALGGGFIAGRLTAPGADRLIQSSAQRSAALAYNAVDQVDPGTQVGRIAFDGATAQSKNVTDLAYQQVLVPSIGKPAYISLAYRNVSGRTLTFHNSPDDEGPAWGQVYVLASGEPAGGAVTDQFAQEPAARQRLAGAQVQVEPGALFEVVVIADGDEDGIPGSSYGLESVGLRLGDGSRQVSVALPDPLQILISEMGGGPPLAQ